MTTLLEIKMPAGRTDLGELKNETQYDCTVKGGEIFGFLSGKNPTLLFRLILRLGELTEGSIVLPELAQGGDLNFHTYLGLAPREKGLLSNLSVLENVELPARYHNFKAGTSSVEDLAKVALTEIKVAENYWAMRPDHVPWEIRKKTLLARAVVCGPKIVILEDPTNMFPWDKLNELYSWIMLQKERQRAILICSENIPFALSVCDTLWNDLLKKSMTREEYLQNKGQEWNSFVAQMKIQLEAQ